MKALRIARRETLGSVIPFIPADRRGEGLQVFSRIKAGEEIMSGRSTLGTRGPSLSAGILARSLVNPINPLLPPSTEPDDNYPESQGSRHGR